MKSTNSRALAALIIATASIATLPAVANAAPAATAPTPAAHQGMGPMGGPMQRMGGRDRILELACSPNGAEALDTLFLHLSYRLMLTDTQRPLFNALREKALTVQTSFADACAAAKPADDADALAKIKSQIAIDTAKLEAINAVLPDFEAFWNSLTDDQKAMLDHGRGMMWGGRGDRAPGADRDAPGRDAPGRDAPGRDAPGRDAPGR